MICRQSLRDTTNSWFFSYSSNPYLPLEISPFTVLSLTHVHLGSKYLARDIWQSISPILVQIVHYLQFSAKLFSPPLLKAHNTIVFKGPVLTKILKKVGHLEKGIRHWRQCIHSISGMTWITFTDETKGINYLILLPCWTFRMMNCTGSRGLTLSWWNKRD